MARTSTKDSKSMMRLANERQGSATAMAAPALGRAMVLDAQRAMNSVAGQVVDAEVKLKKWWDKAQEHNSTATEAGVDALGSVGGLISFEGMNAMLRYLGDKFPNAIGENIDYWQSVPHLTLGVVGYLAEMFTREKATKNGPPILTSFPRRVAKEWSKAFILLGAVNLWRAVRVRGGDAKKQATEAAAVAAQLAAANAEIAKIRQQKQA